MPLSRRQFIHVASRGAATVAFAQLLVRPDRALAGFGPQFAKLDGIAQAEAIKKGDASATEVLNAAIGAIERLNPKINAVVTTDFDRARSRADKNDFHGPFGGVPFLVKDLNEFAGVRTTNGSRAMLANISKTTGPYIQACVDTGFNVVGKSNTPEFGLTGTTESLALGPCYNPWNLDRSAGGSSGGAGAAVAAGMVPIAQGSDGGGSIRIPSSCCGVFGIKPSRGRLIGSTDEFGFSVKGGLSRSVRDNAHLLARTERKHPAPGLKPIGLVNEPSRRRLTIGMYLKGYRGGDPSPDVSDAILATARLCEELGHNIKIMRFEVDGNQMIEDFLTLWSSGPGKVVEALQEELGRKVNHQDLEPLTLAFAERYHNGGKEKVADATKRLQQLADNVNAQMQPYDAVLSPVLSTPPPLIGEQSPTLPYDIHIERAISYVAYTPLYNVTGMPAMSVPLSWNAEDLPIGSQFAAKLGDERTLLQLAYELEDARPWADKWAPWSMPSLPS
jgi:amidase